MVCYTCLKTEECCKAEIIPRFLKFRIPNNGCFDDKSVHDFQKRLLKKELANGRMDLKQSRKSYNNDKFLKNTYPTNCYHLSYYTYEFIENLLRKVKKINGKLNRLSKEQKRPLFNVKNTVMCYNLDRQPPKYVMETLALGPKNSVLDRFDQNDVLAELDELIRYCKGKDKSDEFITDINVKTLAFDFSPVSLLS